MTAAASELAYRTAMTAGPFVDSLAGDVVGIAHALRQGELEHALEAFEMTADRLQRFLTYLVIASELLLETRPALGAVLADYNRRVLDVLGKLERSLDEADLVGLTLTLEHGLAVSLSDYRGYEEDVRQALSPMVAAA